MFAWLFKKAGPEAKVETEPEVVRDEPLFTKLGTNTGWCGTPYEDPEYYEDKDET